MAKNNGEMSGWAGWIGFASFMLLLMGVFAVLAGIAALAKDTVVYHSATNATWVLDYTQWGWIHIIVGVLAILAAGSLAAGNIYGRVFAVLVAFVSAVANMAFVPIYPVWPIVIIAVDVLVIWALTVHRSELSD